MFDWVTDKIDPDLKHSTNLSDEGRAFADAEDSRPLAQERYEAWRNGQPMPKRFAMAWDQWSDKIETPENLPGSYLRSCPKGGGCDHEVGKRSSYKIYHESTNDPYPSYLNYSHYHAPVTNEPVLGINMLYTNEDHRNDGIAEALMRRLNEDHPGVRIVPGDMSNQGKAFHDKMLQKEPAAKDLVTARRRFLAMAWGEWAPKIEGGCDGICAPGDMTMGEYSIDHPNGSGPQPGDLMPGIKGRSLLQFTHDTDQHGNPEIYVSGIHVDEGHRRDGIAEALMRRMRQDHPDTPINPGFTTDDGQGLLDGLKKRIPQAGDALVPRQAAVNQELVDRLHHEFHDWYGQNKDDLYFTEPNNKGMGPLGHWPNIEAFLADHYPAAHRNLDMGMEAAQPLMDGKGLYGDRVPDAPTYETGQAAVDLHGYDPKEIAASMLLLHNGANPQRGDMAQHDQDRLNDIFDKRVKMQRTHEQRNARLAMAWQDWAPHIQSGPPTNLPNDRRYRQNPDHYTTCPPGGGCNLFNEDVGDPLKNQKEGRYFIDHVGDGNSSDMSYLRYSHRRNQFTGDPQLQVEHIHTHPDHRRNNIAESFMRRLHEDHPDIPISPGKMSEDGFGFHNRMLDKEPDARGLVTAGRNGDPPPMTFEPFNTMWSNGIMARHADDGRPIAHLHWHPDGEIETIRVHPELQGRDIAKHVLAHAVTHPETFEARQGIKPSNNLTNAGRAFARSLGHDPSDEEIDPADDDVTNWGWTAVDNYTPMHIPYTGQNEDEMSHYLDKPWTPPERTASNHDDGWPVWWRGRTHPDAPWDKRWHPNHPQHVPGPWDQ
jgi:ribosomal protein S18 acetylase RimI-like enzyme